MANIKELEIETVEEYLQKKINSDVKTIQLIRELKHNDRCKMQIEELQREITQLRRAKLLAQVFKMLNYSIDIKESEYSDISGAELYEAQGFYLTKDERDMFMKARRMYLEEDDYDCTRIFKSNK